MGAAPYFNGSRVWRDKRGGEGGDVVVYGYGSPPTPVWIYSTSQQLPIRVVGDPTAPLATYLGFSFPASAQQQANDEIGQNGTFVPAQCAFFPPISIDEQSHDLYVATTQLYKSTDTDDLRGDSWATVSPVLATPQGTLFDTLDTDNVITAVGVGLGGIVYVGTYTGQVWTSAAPCPDMSCWTESANFGLPISSIQVRPGSLTEAYLALSGFGTTNHVYRTINLGINWDAVSDGLVDAPANVIRFDLAGNLWLGTDIGIYQFNGATWERNQTLPFVPVTDITSWKSAAGAVRVYAATHGRGAWVLTQPNVTTFEGWSAGVLRDLAVFGYAFPNPYGAPAGCKATLLQQSGHACAEARTDATGGAIQVDASGQLQSSNPPGWDNVPGILAWGAAPWRRAECAPFRRVA